MSDKVSLRDKRGNAYDSANPLPNAPQNALVKVPFDEWAMVQPDPSPGVEVYNYYQGGSVTGQLVATVTLTYADSTKQLLIGAKVS